MNVLFPFSVTASTGAAVLVWWQLATVTASPFETAGLALVGTMLALGALEHWLLVLPLPTELLWRWGMRSHSAANAEVPAASAPPLGG
jgi:putative photosynthetic complex assembly protein 2